MRSTASNSAIRRSSFTRARQARRAELPAVHDPPADLTARQMEILTLVARGSTYVEIGESLHLSEPTVRYHMAQIMDHLHLQNRAQVIAYAARHGLSGSASA